MSIGSVQKKHWVHTISQFCKYESNIVKTVCGKGGDRPRTDFNSSNGLELLIMCQITAASSTMQTKENILV